jgi:hypothetical protein
MIIRDASSASSNCRPSFGSPTSWPGTDRVSASAHWTRRQLAWGLTRLFAVRSGADHASVASPNRLKLPQGLTKFDDAGRLPRDARAQWLHGVVVET